VTPKAARNLLIIVALATLVAFAPAGGSTADFVSSTLGAAITVLIVLLLGRLYREHRVAIFSLGDLHRAILYGSLGLFIVAMAARPVLFDTAAGTFGWFAAIGAVIGGLYAVYTRHRSYGY
jgi:hypothetical protein